MDTRELTDAMKRLGLNQTELSSRLELSARTMRRYVAGDARIPIVVELAIAHLELISLRVHIATGVRGRDEKIYTARDVEAFAAMAIAASKIPKS